MAVKLASCPFCGGEPYFAEGFSSFHDVTITCRRCAASSATFDVDDGKPDQPKRNKAEATKAWNARV